MMVSNETLNFLSPPQNQVTKAHFLLMNELIKDEALYAKYMPTIPKCSDALTATNKKLRLKDSKEGWG